MRWTPRLQYFHDEAQYASVHIHWTLKYSKVSHLFLHYLVVYIIICEQDCFCVRQNFHQPCSVSGLHWKVHPPTLQSQATCHNTWINNLLKTHFQVYLVKKLREIFTSRHELMRNTCRLNCCRSSKWERNPKLLPATAVYLYYRMSRTTFRVVPNPTNTPRRYDVIIKQLSYVR